MTRILISLIKVYQHVISPLFAPSCRFAPSCSLYSIEALKRYGAWKGTYLSIRRIVKCNPFHPGGYDPVK
ncbi:MAG TPA: membrane protein insertion efficiency factor YidD [Thermodesulfovibrionales bacterium]|jgi:putative membrane protein insertion efficiency factor|nr:membrane protein insertion efficiency factor YidD [Thermodesulfovibrionales bacterium]